MNGRLYDPTVGRMLSPDNYVQDALYAQTFNRYAYAHNNPLKFTDPDGEFAFVPIIGAIIGAYIGGATANGGNFNFTQWDYSSGKTWGGIIGGGIMGAVSAGIGNAIATSGVPFANTLATVATSFVNSVGTHVYTGGQTDVSISIGVASLNISNGEFGYLGKKGNTWTDNLAYAFGAMGNIQDAFAFTSGTNLDVKSRPKLAGHSEITGEYDKQNILISVGPENGGPASIRHLRGMKWENEFLKLQLKGTPYPGENVSYIDPPRLPDTNYSE